MAQLLTTAPRSGDHSRRSAGLALLSASVGVGALAVIGLNSGPLRLVAAAVLALAALFGLMMVSEALEHGRRERLEQQLLYTLVRGLPPNWYVLGDLQVEPSWLEPVRIWAAVVSPGGVAVIQPCTEVGDVMPLGHLWVVGRGRRTRTIPSPAAEACTAVEALREVVGTEVIPIVPVVALTDLSGTFHQAETGAHVVGAPHVAAGLQRYLAGSPKIWDAFQLSTFLARYSR